MGFSEWFSENWVNIATAVSGIGGLWAAVFALRKNAKATNEEAKARKVANLLAEVSSVFTFDGVHGSDR